ncbi:PEP/pyruvate-binding domain-containing protein [Flammeovirgaceae bacterium SG7u.111]|nr:PEP/pyruvate-binding domain-containing protein [Flammeovirgaceae bacterium SG7u.132]WPO37295.1 PEP/pyruvate-binding domain-containing protein [Flammeovirgaceae bacterium SG7u.111]
MRSYTILFFFFCNGFCLSLFAQAPDNVAIAEQIQKLKKDARGPYKDIRWFCKDGSILMPTERCPEKGGVQRARYKDEVVALAKNHHIFIGQILSTTLVDDFWDAAHNQSRLKQYMLEKYLRTVDNGWVLQKGQYYRGAIQIEDEEEWGKEFFTWLLKDSVSLVENYFLVRQALKDVPHFGDNNKAQLIRSQSKILADTFPAFMNLRIKIHGQPDASDITSVEKFKASHSQQLSPKLTKQFDGLIDNLKSYYELSDVAALKSATNKLSPTSALKTQVNSYLSAQYTSGSEEGLIQATAQLMWEIRVNLPQEKSKDKLALLDISNLLETYLLKQLSKWKCENLQELLHRIQYLSLASAGAGFVEKWEWEKIEAKLQLEEQNEMSLGDLTDYMNRGRSQLEWGIGMNKAVFQETINLFYGFEKMASGFIDDRIRASVLLDLGNSIGQLGDIIAKESSLTNQVLGIANQSHIRGLNPGFSKGELQVVEGVADEIEVAANKIYIFERAPADLKPVAGIATVSEGNMVSHVQLLARNLGIPNAIVSDVNLKDLMQFSGKQVFYAVSSKGTVIMKDTSEMTEVEKKLFAGKRIMEEKIRVPIDKMQLGITTLPNLRTLKANDSGIICGPKAANLGQLKYAFPDNVVEGFVIPFGVFREHMDQKLPDSEQTYWEFLTQTFEEAESMAANGIDEAEIEEFQLKQLAQLREDISKITFLPSFLENLETSFQEILGKPMGKIAVFLRSDTNMEDLKDFTGAGLNLTIFNAAAKDKILQGIKSVWASPYTERSFKWRQKFLLNPENVYPSILIIPSVDVNYSGVLITKGVSNGNTEDLTIAFSRGAGGAVDGQTSETYLVKSDGENSLLSPARETYYNQLPTSGGVLKGKAKFNKPILQPENIEEIRKLTQQLKEVMPTTPGIESDGPFDVELGFLDNKLWLFQVRPFVENKKAVSSDFLQSIDPEEVGTDKTVSLLMKL